MTLLSFIAERLFSCGLFLYPVNHSLGLTPPAAFEASFLSRWDPRVSRYKHRLNILAVGGKIFLSRYKTNLTVKPVAHLLVSHLDQTRPYSHFFRVSEHGSHNEAAEAVQWHISRAETLPPAAPMPLCTSVTGSQHATSSGRAAANSKQLLKGNLLGDFGCHHLADVLNELLGLSQLTSLECLFPELAGYTACM